METPFLTTVIESETMPDDFPVDTSALAFSNPWKNTTIYILFICVILGFVLGYYVGSVRKLTRRIRALEHLLVEHGITTNERPFHCMLSSDDQYDELNPFISVSKVADELVPKEVPKEVPAKDAVVVIQDSEEDEQHHELLRS